MFPHIVDESQNIQSVLDFTLAQSLSVAEAELGNVQLMDWKTGYLEIASQRGFGEEFLTFFKRVAATDGSACARTLRRRESIIIPDVMWDIEFTPYQTIACRAGVRAVQSTPCGSGFASSQINNSKAFEVNA